MRGGDHQNHHARPPRRKRRSNTTASARLFAAVDLLSDSPHANAQMATDLVGEWMAITERVGSLFEACLWASDRCDPDTKKVMRAFVRSVQSSDFIAAGDALVRHAAAKLQAIGEVSPLRHDVDDPERPGRAAWQTHHFHPPRRGGHD